MIHLNAKIPAGPIQDRWDAHKFRERLVNPSNKRKYKIIVIGTGLAGASAAASFGELGYEVEAFTYNDSARRAHSIAAQGGINAAARVPATRVVKLHHDFNGAIHGVDLRVDLGHRTYRQGSRRGRAV